MKRNNSFIHFSWQLTLNTDLRTHLNPKRISVCLRQVLGLNSDTDSILRSTHSQEFFQFTNNCGTFYNADQLPCKIHMVTRRQNISLIWKQLRTCLVHAFKLFLHTWVKMSQQDQIDQFFNGFINHNQMSIKQLTRLFRHRLIF